MCYNFRFCSFLRPMFQRVTYRRVGEPPPDPPDEEMEPSEDKEEETKDDQSKKQDNQDKPESVDYDDDEEGDKDSSFRCTDEPDDLPDYEDEEERTAKGDEGILSYNNPMATYCEAYLKEVVWYYGIGRFINRVRPNFVFLHQDDRDHTNSNHTLHGIEFFKQWEHVGDRTDDLKGYQEYKKSINDYMLKVQDHRPTWHLIIVPSMFNYQGRHDMPTIYSNVEELAKLLNITNVKEL